MASVGATSSVRFLGMALVASSALVGCGSDGSDGGAGTAPVDVQAPEFVEGQGQLPNATPAYPSGPFGIRVGSILPNYQFIGYPNALADSSALQTIQFADFYNPTGTDVYPEGSPYGAGTPKPKALMLQFAAGWCGPCNYEADQILPDLLTKYKPMGGMFFMQLTDGNNPGTAAKTKDLNNWTAKYDVDYPATLDPTYKMSLLFEAAAYPANFIIDTRTMEIVEVLAGAAEPGDPFWDKFESVLNGG
jgi:thiol-disulfide isomerase/thioredoxin